MKVGDESGEVYEKSRARDNMERGESNVREEGRGDASDGCAGTSVGPIVMGG